ncbi:MAG TPA: DUF1080 domain-containing protein [Ferruginibacter sp.]|nr:DUF1080 domain-containing protein [Ferruginibacter sp.]HMP19851.1 DUF1080 domain-containing protein [Ferruginibacter sp.]
MKWLAIAAAAAVFISCNAGSTAENAETSTPVADTGWISLFDGKTTSGWHSYGKSTIGSAWKVADGVLYLDTTQKDGWQIKDGGDIVTNDEYENFHFKTDWKIAKDGNSGIIFLVHEDTTKYKYVWFTGPEMQVLDNNGHPDAKIIKHRAGDLYDLISSTREVVKPAGEWNTAEIIINNGKLDLILNGDTSVSTTLWDDAWNTLVAGSKFKDMPDFAKFKKGKLALQDHGNEVQFRNIMIKKL